MQVDLRGAAFDQHITSLLLLIGELMDRMVETALGSFVRAMKPYYKMRSWSFKRHLKELDKLDVSLEFCEALTSVKVCRSLTLFVARPFVTHSRTCLFSQRCQSGEHTSPPSCLRRRSSH